MLRDYASKLVRTKLDENGLTNWKIRLITDLNKPFLGKCSYKDKTIYLNAHHLDTHPDEEIENTILHEIAHALTPNHGHDEVWKEKARELGCDNTATCGPALSAEAIDAMRSGHLLEVTFEEEIIRKPSYKVTRIQEHCPTCGKVAKELFTIPYEDKVIRFLECGHSIIRITPKATPFDTLVSLDGKKLYPFQIEGARFLEKANGRGALFDEMGLGKTVQALAYLKFHSEVFPVLFIVKSGIKLQWFKEIINWLGYDYVAQVINTSRDIVLPGLKCYIVSYDLLRRFDRKEIEKAGIKTVVLDECQLIKNPDSTRTQEVRRIVKNVQHVIPLSGTPWKNRGSEFFVVLNLLDPIKFYSYQHFLNRWVDYYWDGGHYKMGGIRKVEEFKEHIKDIAIRRMRSEAMPELPAITRNRFHCELDEPTGQAYDKEVDSFINWYNSQVIGGEENSFETQQNMMARIARMRHITGLAKIPYTIEFIEEFIEETERKLCIFVHHKDVGEHLYNLLMKNKVAQENNVKILKLTAEMDSDARYNVQEEFNQTKRAVLIASTLASGEGLNLQSCCDCIMHERQWNPQNEEQAEGRFIRIGREQYGIEKEPVTATYMTAVNTVDEQLANIVEKKRLQFHAAMNKGDLPKWNESSIVRELAEAIVGSRKKAIVTIKGE